MTTRVTASTDKDPHLMVLTFDGPDRLNAMGRQTWLDLKDHLDTFEADDDLSAMVLTGKGRAFIAGADIKELATYDPEQSRAFGQLARVVTDRLEATAKPVLAAVHGYALGGGFELMLACDVIVCSRETVFGLPEITRGTLPGGGGTQRLPASWVSSGRRSSL